MTTAKLFENGRSQAVRLPKEYRFPGQEVLINRVGDIVLLMPKKDSWDSFVKALDLFTEDYMEEGRPAQGMQKRDSL
ncbi:MAG: antitoxin [Lachnospiraceae bacterium]|nr:antitoxin [Lachnospiraceae bacterium]